jgi:hypothetical protein
VRRRDTTVRGCNSRVCEINKHASSQKKDVGIDNNMWDPISDSDVLQWSSSEG